MHGFSSDLSDNLLFGDRPFSISKLKQLELLNLKNNQLTGPISTILGFYKWSLQGNGLTGKISEVTGLMDLSENESVGPIPSIFGNLSYTGKLNVNGSIPSGFKNLESLTYLDLCSNESSGFIPGCIGDLEHLLTL
ncbi:hypothetical protein K7X08_030949 [Anisodus acutangulus]|uniref:Uncharacterized protein n=1 Tax=Anisodus acutangulus TaxID=402998 RepID=A0A9Q1N0F0_9SOLA|nr:hypothetical protein K7X08_030949 [Anisodus acutangulus]